jgi:transposase
MEQEKGRRKRRRYTQEFKDDAVRLVLEGTPIGDLADKLGVERSCLGRWRARYLGRLERSDQGGAEAMSPKELVAEIERLRKQLKTSELHREILKKALTIFSQDPRNGLSL